MKKITFTILFFLLFSVILFGQSYMGPDSGGVASGIVVTTDDFLFAPTGSESHEAPRVYEVMEYEPEAMVYEGNKPVSDNYVYVDDKNTKSSPGGEIGISFELHSFESISFVNGWPPDPAMSVGPNHVIASVNGRFNIYDREGNLLKSISETPWINQVVITPVISDPQVIYDHYNGRWVMLWFTRSSAILEAPFVICYSDDDNPLGTWYMYAIGSELNGSTYAGNWGDYPKIGYDHQGLYINSRQFAFAGGYNYNKLRTLNSTDFYSAKGGPINWTDIWDIRIGGQAVDVIHPCYSYDAGIDTAYFVYARSGSSSTNFYTLFRIINPISNPVLTSVNLPIQPYNRAPSANQLGGNSVDVFTWIAKAPILRDGKIYAAHSIRNSQFTTNASLKYFIIDTGTDAVVEQVEQGAQGYYYITPAITVDKDLNIAITYSRSADTEYIGAYYSTKLVTDPPGLSQSKVMIEGGSNFSSNSRWGDYFSAAVDPINQYDIWMYTQYKPISGEWSTWLTEIRMKPYPGASLYTKLNPVEFGDNEVGTNPTTEIVTISNYGEDDLVINSITSPTGPFTLLTPLNYPVTLSTFDSLDLEIEFNPTSPAIYNELMAFDDNDLNFDGLTLNGTAFLINQAYTDVLYASTGTVENGKTLAVNRNSGAGSELGLSNFDDLNSLTIDPVANIMYGISSDDFSTELTRVNGTGGDAFTQYTLDLGTMVGIGFTSTGTMYGALRSGDIYTIDLTDGSYSLVVTADRQLTSMEIDPMTDIMYAAPRIVIGAGKDRIYTVNTATGETTLIGQTGFGVTTNDMAFDENGVMYGVIGGSNEEGQLITINTTDAAGTMVGGIGFQNVLGLGYAINGIVNSVTPDDGKDFIPKEFALSQNYPNPFNPSTSIKFSVPVDSKVILTIYNLLGQAVTTLVNEEISSGNYSVIWNGADQNGLEVSSGVYLYKMKANGSNGKEFQQIRKMVLLK